MSALTALRRALLAALAAHQYGALFVLLLMEEAGGPLPLPGDTPLAGDGVGGTAWSSRRTRNP